MLSTGPRLPWGLDFEPAGLPEGLAVDLRFDEAGALLRATLRADARVTPGEVCLRAALDTAAASGWAWIHGRSMTMDALVKTFGAPEPDGYHGGYRRALEDGVQFTSREVCVVTLPAKATPSLVAGLLRGDRYFLSITVETTADEEVVTGLGIVYHLEGLTLEAGELVELPPVYLAEGRDPRELVEAYADAVAQEMGARVPAQIPSGWCSWYQYYDRVTEGDIIENVARLRDEGYPVDVVQVDDGYQAATGDWLTANERFPSGMAALAARIGEAGFTPGLWLAPLVLHESSATLRDHPEMVLRTPGGETYFVDTWLGRCAVVDCTHPDAEAWLRGVIGAVVHEWGYRYLKLDALVFAAAPGDEVSHHVAGTTGPANLRRGLEIIREAAGDETFILGCTCPFAPAIGLVDAMRVGPDVKATWEDGPRPSVRHAMRLTLQRNWMHRRWWANDPDCLVVRAEDTGLGEAEVRFLATAIALSGGLVVSSDDLAKVPAERRRMVRALMPPAGVAAYPMEPDDGPVPRAWRAELGDGRSLVGILNWGDEPAWIPVHEYLEPGERAFDCWSGELLGKGDLLLRPHEGSLWQVTAAGKGPRLLGDTGHIAGARLSRRAVSGRLQLGNDDREPRTVVVEARGRITVAELAPGERRWFD